MSALVFHDAFSFQGGGERVAVELTRALDADLVTGHFEPQAFQADFLGDVRPRTLKAYDRALLGRLSKTAALWRAFASMDRVRADRAVFSGQVCPLGHKRVEGLKVMYCHTPPRILYDLRGYYLEKISPWLRPAYMLFLKAYEAAYRESAKGMDIIFANSENVRGRIRRYLGLDSRVLYPPCGQGFAWLGQGGYYLSTARLDPLKRVEKIVEAFASMPDKKLVVVSGGPCEQEIRAMAADAPNVSVEGFVPQKGLAQLMGNCIASIYIPRDEDFGMSPVESMAAGKPVIGVREGGLPETVVEGETGTLIPARALVADIQDAVRWLSPDRAAAMRPACERRAVQFSRAAFGENLRAALAERS